MKIEIDKKIWYGNWMLIRNIRKKVNEIMIYKL